MTAQISDSLLWNGVEHDVVAIEEPWLFSPREHGFVPVSPHTACWRGYINRYAIASDRLVLRTLVIGAGDAVPPRWRGIAPRRDAAGEMWEYAGVDFPLPYSGGIVIGTGFRRELYVHRGFPPAYAFERVLELAIEDGRLQKVADRSAAMARVRSIIEQAGGVPEGLIAKVMSRVFAASYDDPWF